MRRLLPACAVFCSAVVLMAGFGAALTAEVPPAPIVTDSGTVAKDAPNGDGNRYWVEVAAKRCPVK